MPKVGYASLVETLRLRVSPPARPAFVDTSVNRRLIRRIASCFPPALPLRTRPWGIWSLRCGTRASTWPSLPAPSRRLAPPRSSSGCARAPMENTSGERRFSGSGWAGLRSMRGSASQGLTSTCSMPGNTSLPIIRCAHRPGGSTTMPWARHSSAPRSVGRCVRRLAGSTA